MMKNKTKKTVVQGTYHVLQRQQPHRIEFSCMAVLASDLPSQMFCHSPCVQQTLYYFFGYVSIATV